MTPTDSVIYISLYRYFGASSPSGFWTLPEKNWFSVFRESVADPVFRRKSKLWMFSSHCEWMDSGKRDFLNNVKQKYKPHWRTRLDIGSDKGGKMTLKKSRGFFFSWNYVISKMTFPSGIDGCLYRLVLSGKLQSEAFEVKYFRKWLR